MVICGEIVVRGTVVNEFVEDLGRVVKLTGGGYGE